MRRSRSTFSQCRRNFSKFSSSKGATISVLGPVVFGSLAGLCGYLGYWQVHRRRWKIDLIKEREDGLKGEPMPLMDAVRDGVITECQKVECVGEFDYSRQMLVGLRSVPGGGQGPGQTNAGYWVITPLVTDDGEILVNRGYIYKEDIDNCPFEDSVKPGSLRCMGVLISGEKENPYLVGYEPDLNAMQSITMHPPLLEDALGVQSLVPKGEEGTSYAMVDLQSIDGQEGTTLIRKPLSEYSMFSTRPFGHTIYAGTWFALGAALAVLSVRFRRSPKQYV